MLSKTPPIHLIVVGLHVGQSYSASLNPPILARQTTPALCNESSAWQPTIDAYTNAGTDQKLSVWWGNGTGHNGDRFDDAFWQIFGDNSVRCGIAVDGNCVAPSCFEVEGLSDLPWYYLAAISIQNLNSMFNTIYNGINLGQTDFGDVTDNLADGFFHWQDPIDIGAEVAFWVGAAVTTVATFVTGPLRGPVAVGVGAFLNAASQQADQSLRPAANINRESGISALKVFALAFSQAARNGTETWADSTFSGLPDLTGKTILDYLMGGSFVDGSLIPNSTDVEEYYKSAMIARTINLQWRRQAIYLVGTTGELTDPRAYPAGASYRSPNTGTTYVPYYFDGKAQQEPPGLSLLNQSYYGILPSQIAESSARAWEYAGNNYTMTLASQRIEESLASNGNLTPFKDGAGWEGMFTLPACDVGSHTEWLVPFGGKMLPCCCGQDCADTKAFVQAANLNKSEDFLDRCRTQLQGTDLDFNSIDYGIHAGSKLHQWWHRLSTGAKAGIIIGGVFGFIFIMAALASCA